MPIPSRPAWIMEAVFGSMVAIGAEAVLAHRNPPVAAMCNPSCEWAIGRIGR